MSLHDACMPCFFGILLDSQLFASVSWKPVRFFVLFFGRHRRQHWNFQLSPCVFDGFFIFTIFRIDEINASQPSSIIELWFPVCPFLLFSLLIGISNFGPNFSNKFSGLVVAWIFVSLPPDHIYPFCQCSTKCLSLVVESLSSVVLLGYPRPSLAGIGAPWVLTGTHRCALMPRVASGQSVNPLWFVLSWSRVVMDVVGQMCCREPSVRCWNWEYLHACSTKNNIYKLSVVTDDSRSKFPCERLPSPCFVKRSAVLCFVSSSRFVLSLSTVQALCNLAGVVLELLLDEMTNLLNGFITTIEVNGFPLLVLRHETQDVRFRQNWASRLQQFYPILHPVFWHGFRTISFRIKTLETTNVLAWTFEHTQQLWEHSQNNFLCFLVLSNQCHGTVTWRWSFLWVALVHTLIHSSSPGKIFHSNSIGSPSIRSKSLRWRVSKNQLILVSHALTGSVLIPPWHSTESEETLVLAVANWTALSVSRVVSLHVRCRQSIQYFPFGRWSTSESLEITVSKISWIYSS